MPDVLERKRDATTGIYRGAGTRSPYRSDSKLDTTPSASQSGQVGLALFLNTVRTLFDCPPEKVTALHQEAVQQIRRALDPMPYVEALLDLCVKVRSEGGLDVATDILSQTDDLALRYAQEFRQADAARWAPEQNIDYDPNDDKWLVLLRAIARSSGNHPDSYRLVVSCLSAGNRGIREAVAEGLAELASPAALAMLRSIAQDDPDPLIREIAQVNLSGPVEN